MEEIRSYLLGVVAAAVFCGIATKLVNTKSTVGIAIKLLAGFLMILSVVRPWAEIRMDDFLSWTDSIQTDGAFAVADGVQLADESYRQGIKQRIEAYVVDEAKAYDCQLTVDVILSEEALAVPLQIRLSGEASPYARQALTNLLSERLGIEREDLIWT